MIMNVMTQVLSFGAGIIVCFIVTYLINQLLVKWIRKAVFIIPALLVLAMIVFVSIALIGQGWAALGYLLMAGFALVGFIGSIISGCILWFKTKPKVTKE